MRVEVQDNFLGGSRNNANMSTPSDGIRPRMQMFTWFGPQAATLTLTPGGNVPVGTAAFGPANFDLTAQVALANDGVGRRRPTPASRSPALRRPDRARRPRHLHLHGQGAQRAGRRRRRHDHRQQRRRAAAPGLGGADPLVTIGAAVDHPGRRRGAEGLAGGGTGHGPHVPAVTGTERDGASTTRSSPTSGATTSTTGWPTAASSSAAR